MFPPNGYPIRNRVHVCSISPCQTLFPNVSVAGSYGYGKQWIAWQLIDNVCTQGPSANFSARDRELVHRYAARILAVYLKKGCVQIQ